MHSLSDERLQNVGLKIGMYQKKVGIVKELSELPEPLIWNGNINHSGFSIDSFAAREFFAYPKVILPWGVI